MDEFKQRAKEYGPWGAAIVAIAIALIPTLNGTYQTHRKENREDVIFAESACAAVLQDVREDNRRLRHRVDELAFEVAELTAAVRMSRRADHESKLAKWELDHNLRLIWFNPAFSRMALVAQDIDPRDCYNKTWDEIMRPEVAANANVTDREVMVNLRAISYDNGMSIEKRANGTYKVFWNVIKEALIDDDGRFRGIRGTAYPYDEEKTN